MRVTADTSLPLNVDTILVHGNFNTGFGFSPRCPASRLYENAGKGQR
jgi:hypothetical protein